MIRRFLASLLLVIFVNSARPAPAHPDAHRAAASHEVILRLRPEAPGRLVGLALARLGTPIIDELPALHAVLVRTDGRIDRTAAVLAALPFVESAQPNTAQSVPDPPGQRDPRATDQWHLSAIGEPLAGVGGDAPAIAIVDTGVNYRDPDLAARVVNANSGPVNNFVDGTNDPMDDHGHGTHVAGIAAAASNAVRGRGVSPGSPIVAVKVLNASGQGSCWGGAKGIDYARSYVGARVRVINLSFGGYQACPLQAEAVRAATRDGILVVAAAGNNNTTRRFYPAGYDATLAVAAVEQHGCRAYFSNYGDSTGHWVDVAAPGYEILSLDRFGSMTTVSGTSQATPVVAGIAARYWARRPGATPAQVRMRILSTGARITCGFPEKQGVAGADLAAVLGLRGGTLTGRILDATSGRPVEDANVTLVGPGGRTVRASTNASGFYTASGLAAGRQQLTIRRRDFVTLTRNLDFPRRDTVEDLLAPVRADGQWTITLQWRATQPFDVLGRRGGTPSAELDAVLGHPDTAVGYVDFRNPGSLRAPIEAELKRNSTSDLEPVEAIVISRLRAGRYRFGVLRLFATPASIQWGALGTSRAVVRVYEGDRLRRSFGVPPDCGSHNWWYAFDVDGGQIVRAGTCSADAPPDIDPPF